MRGNERLAPTGNRRLPPPHALVVFDINHVKSINDRFGYQIGNRVIVAATQAAVAAVSKHLTLTWLVAKRQQHRPEAPVIHG